MRRVLGVLLGLAMLSARAGSAPIGCVWLCGTWMADGPQSQAAEPLVDAALRDFKEPKSRRPPRPPPEEAGNADEPASPDAPPGPGSMKTALRTQLLAALEPPASLVVRDQANVILIGISGGEERRVFPGAPHSRVTAQGTIKISTQWKKNALVVREDQGPKYRTTETYAQLPDGNLHLTRVVERPGLKTLRLSVIYRRGQTQALESATAGRTQIRAP